MTKKISKRQVEEGSTFEEPAKLILASLYGKFGSPADMIQRHLEHRKSLTERMSIAPKFKLGDRVQIARILDSMTSRELIGKVGVVQNVDDIKLDGINLQVNYDVCITAEETDGSVKIGYHYMHEQELEPAES